MPVRTGLLMLWLDSSAFIRFEKPRNNLLFQKAGESIKKHRLSSPMNRRVTTARFSYVPQIFIQVSKLQKNPKIRQPYPQNPIEGVVCSYRRFVFDVCSHSLQVNLKEQGQLIRQDEFLVTLRKKKCFRHIFLFQELVLFSKTRKTEVGNDTYIYKQSFKVHTYAKRPQIQE